MEHVLVTGASGFLGIHSVNALLAQGMNVTALVRDSSQTRQLSSLVKRASNLTWMHCDVEALHHREILPPGSTIVHLAGDPRSNQSHRDVTVESELQRLSGVLAAAHRSRFCRVIYASSSLVYGQPLDYPITEGFPVSHESAYTTAKLQAETMLRSADIDSVALRLFNVYGPGQSSGTVMGKICLDAATGSTSFCREDPQLEPPIDFVYVGDVARVIAALASAESFPLHTLNVGSGCSARPTQVADAILGATRGVSIADALCRVDVGSASRLCLESVVGTQSVTPLETGIAQTIDWTLSVAGRGARGSEPPEIP